MVVILTSGLICASLLLVKLKSQLNLKYVNKHSLLIIESIVKNQIQRENTINDLKNSLVLKHGNKKIYFSLPQLLTLKDYLNLLFQLYEIYNENHQ